MQLAEPIWHVCVLLRARSRASLWMRLEACCEYTSLNSATAYKLVSMQRVDQSNDSTHGHLTARTAHTFAPPKTIIIIIHEQAH